MKAVYAFLFLLLVSFKGFSQFDSPKKVVNIAPISDPKGSISPTSSKAITYPSIFDKKDKLLSGVSLLNKKPEEDKSTMEEKQFADPAVEYKKTFDKLAKDVAPQYVAQNFGNVRSKTKRIKILCRDYDAVDGDMVRVLLDNNQVFACTLQGDNTVFYVDLTSNLNIIDFEAVNEGFSPPNTAEFTILDDDDNVIYTNRWALSVGYRARISISK